MFLWFLGAGLLALGTTLAALLERERRVQPWQRTAAETVGVSLIYTAATGGLVAFNLFKLGRIDPFFETTPWYVFGILYWPSWVLTFSPLVLGGVVSIVAGGLRRPQRTTMFVLVLVATLVALEIVFLVGLEAVGVAGTALVQAVLLGGIIGVVWRLRRAEGR